MGLSKKGQYTYTSCKRTFVNEYCVTINSPESFNMFNNIIVSLFIDIPHKHFTLNIVAIHLKHYYYMIKLLNY